MVRRGIARSRTHAQRLLAEGNVRVVGIERPRPATKVDAAIGIDVEGASPYVGRGGDKLAAALAAFPLRADGRRALDVGASAGGFTDCLLQHGAAAVVAIDVGRAQLADELRSDPRVELWEGLDVRDAARLEETFELVTVDLSFISLCSVAAHLSALANPAADLIALVKPQFEVGRSLVGRGVVTDHAFHSESVKKVTVCMGNAGLTVKGVIESPILGTHGNREFLMWAVKQ
jgi:23S rRNA (cytidine1920-2'-O)/16S rRNA (cytidine1409-2'-O)-methyltransferase